jgi:hypothetical protein
MARLMAQLIKVFALPGLMLLAITAAAQTRPDFSGRWTSPEASTASGVRGVAIEPGTMGSGWGAEMTIDHRAPRLTVERAQFSQYDMQPPMLLTYALDGSESRNIVNMGRGPQELVSKSAWQDASLVITTSYRFTNPKTGKPETSDVRQTLSFDASGSLVVTTTHAGALGGPPSTSTTTYTKH